MPHRVLLLLLLAGPTAALRFNDPRKPAVCPFDSVPDAKRDRRSPASRPKQIMAVPVVVDGTCANCGKKPWNNQRIQQLGKDISEFTLRNSYGADHVNATVHVAPEVHVAYTEIQKNNLAGLLKRATDIYPTALCPWTSVIYLFQKVQFPRTAMISYNFNGIVLNGNSFQGHEIFVNGLSSNSDTTTITAIHEWGHVLGFMHANGLDSPPFGPIRRLLYEDRFDKMGSGRVEGGTYGAVAKVFAGWITASGVKEVPTTLTDAQFTLWPHDEPSSEGKVVLAHVSHSRSGPDWLNLKLEERHTNYGDSYFLSTANRGTTPKDPFKSIGLLQIHLIGKGPSGNFPTMTFAPETALLMNLPDRTKPADRFSQGLQPNEAWPDCAEGILIENNGLFPCPGGSGLQCLSVRVQRNKVKVAAMCAGGSQEAAAAARTLSPTPVQLPCNERKDKVSSCAQSLLEEKCKQSSSRDYFCQKSCCEYAASSSSSSSSSSAPTNPQGPVADSCAPDKQSINKCTKRKRKGQCSLYKQVKEELCPTSCCDVPLSATAKFSAPLDDPDLELSISGAVHVSALSSARGVVQLVVLTGSLLLSVL